MMPYARSKSLLHLSTRARIALLGCAALACGLALYIFVRDPASLYVSTIAHFGAFNLPLPTETFHHGLSMVTGSLPSALHSLSFSLFTAIALGPTLRSAKIACITWISIDTAFEGLQSREYFCGPNSATANVNELSCLLQGRFDWLDVASVFAGGALAYYLIRSALFKRVKGI
jgi:hypothetical protein